MRGRDRAESVGYVLALACAVAAPVLGRYASLPFAALAAGDAVSRSRWPPDRYVGRGRQLTVFAAAAAGLALAVAHYGLPFYLVTAPVALVVGAQALSAVRWTEGDRSGLSYLVGGGIAASVAGAVTAGAVESGVALAVANGTVVAATARSVAGRDRPATVFVLGAAAMVASSWLPATMTVSEIAAALLVTGALGAFAYSSGTMSADGTYGGVLLSFVTIVASDYSWFLLLGLFVVLGAVWSRYREEEKVAMGVTEVGESRRGFSNVMANGGVALVGAVLWGVASSPGMETVASLLFAGGLAAATGDTLSSEIGSVHGEARLITTLEHVPPGTDGGVSAVGELVTVVGAAAFAVAAVGLGVVDPPGAVAVAIGGVVGTHVDSLLGATVEGPYVGNDAVNLLSTTAGAVAAVAVAPYLL